MTVTSRSGTNGLTEDQRRTALDRFQILRPHLEEDIPLDRIAHEQKLSSRTLSRWAANYRRLGLREHCRKPHAGKDKRRVLRKHSVNPPSFGRRALFPRPLGLSVESEIGIDRTASTQGLYDVSDPGISSSHPHARFCSGLRFHGRNRSTSSTARPPASAHASR